MKKIFYLNFLLFLMITMLPNVYAKEDVLTIDFKDNYNNIKLIKTKKYGEKLVNIYKGEL